MYFLSRILRQAIFYILFALDLLGVAITYYSQLQVPKWLLIVIPITAIFLACFNLYRQGTADVRMVFNEESSPKYICSNSKGSREYNYVGAINGHILNYGPQTGVLEEIEFEVGCNDIFDEYLLSRILIMNNLPHLLRGKVELSEKEYDEEIIKLPLVLKSGDIQPFTLFINFKILVAQNEDIVIDILQWLKLININIVYLIRQSEGISRKEIKLALPAGSMFDATLASEGGIQTFD
jgi:hypothetical protein